MEQDSLREGADDCVQEVKGLSWEMEENRERMMGLLASEARWYGGSMRPLAVRE